MSTWFITGAVRGFGRALALHALAQGDSVAATGRDLAQVEAAYAEVDAAERLLPVALDVTEADQARDAVQATVDRFGGIDYLVNNAGHGLLGAVEETSAAEVAAVFEVNVFGVLNVTRAALPQLRRQRSGHIVNIGSMGGFAQVAGWGVYGATKFALEGLSESLAAELAPLGIGVTVVEPGGFRTDFLEGTSLQLTRTQLPDYDATAGEVRRAATRHAGSQLNDPAKGAAALYRVVTSDAPPIRLQLGPDAVAMVEDKLRLVRSELERWRVESTSTPFDAEPA